MHQNAYPAFERAAENSPLNVEGNTIFYVKLSYLCNESNDFRWYDLHHIWASWLARGSVSLNVLQEMGEWESTEMVRRYAHLAPEQFHSYAKVVDNVLNGTFTAQGV